MSTQAGAPYLLKRVAVRAGVGVWRHRGGVLLAAFIAAGVGTYTAMTWTGNLPTQLMASASSALTSGLSTGTAAGTSGRTPRTTGGAATANGAAAANTDCADTAIAAIADKSAAASSRAYQCMDPTFQQRVTEADFVRQMQTQKLPNVNKLARVSEYRSAAGGTMVYYALDGSGGQSVGYIVYVGQNGKVQRIE
ncbi:MAG TPA: hypothetical protein VGQ62_22010 [Chloroflexota bacterium]|jgi:hypothetical protein|nr:hypothetical protein [Chloroflexota bacterium]